MKSLFTQLSLRTSYSLVDSTIAIDALVKKAKSKNLKTALGGAISIESKSFIKNLVDNKLIEKFETRKLVFRNSSIHSIDEGLKKGVNFELLWLKSKRRYYHRIRNEDEKRIEMLEKRLKNT